MKQLEDIIREKLIGYDSPLPEDSFAQFQARRKAVSQAPAKKRFPVLWVTMAAAAAGISAFVIIHTQITFNRSINDAHQLTEVAEKTIINETPVVVSESEMTEAPTAPKVLKKPSHKQQVVTKKIDVATVIEMPAENHDVDRERHYKDDKSMVEEPLALNVPLEAPGEIWWQDAQAQVKPAVRPVSYSLLFAAGDVPLSGVSASRLFEQNAQYVSSGYSHIHYQPVKAGVSASIPLTNNLSLSAGLDYSLFVTSYNYSIAAAEMAKSIQYAHYIGVPLRLNWTFISKDNLDIYAGAGVETDFFVGATLGNSHVRKDGSIFSLIGSGGIQWNYSKHFALYVEPSLSWVPASNQRRLETYLSERPVMLLVATGLRFNMVN